MEFKNRCVHKTMWGQKKSLTKTTFGPHPVAFGVFSGHAEAMLVLESMRHDNRAEGVSVDFRRGGEGVFVGVGSCEILEEFKVAGGVLLFWVM